METIKEYRISKNMTLAEFGNLLTPPVHKSTVLRWQNVCVPAKRCVEIEKTTGILRNHLRPDLFGDKEP